MLYRKNYLFKNHVQISCRQPVKEYSLYDILAYYFMLYLMFSWTWYVTFACFGKAYQSKVLVRVLYLCNMCLLCSSRFLKVYCPFCTYYVTFCQFLLQLLFVYCTNYLTFSEKERKWATLLMSTPTEVGFL